MAVYLPSGITHSENGIIGMSPLPDESFGDRKLMTPEAAWWARCPELGHSTRRFPFGLIRGGHVDVTVLGGLEVDEEDTSPTG